MRELIGKRFELTDVLLHNDTDIVGVTLVGDDEVVKLEADAVDHGLIIPIILHSIESLVDPPSEEVKTDVFGGNFVAQ